MMDADDVQEHAARIIREILQDIDASLVDSDPVLELATEADRLKVLRAVRSAEIWFEWELEAVDIPDDGD